MRSMSGASSAEAIRTRTDRVVVIAVTTPTKPAWAHALDGERTARGPDPRRVGKPRDVAVERRPVHPSAVPRLVELGRAVLGAAIVPEHGVADAPAVPIHEIGTRRPLLKIADQVPALRFG